MSSFSKKKFFYLETCLLGFKKCENHEKTTRKCAETLVSHLKVNFLTKKSQKIQFKIERNFKSSQFARICDFHIRLWVYTSFLANKTEGNEKILLGPVGLGFSLRYSVKFFIFFGFCG